VGKQCYGAGHIGRCGKLPGTTLARLIDGVDLGYRRPKGRGILRQNAVRIQTRDAIDGGRADDVVRLSAEFHAEIVRLSGSRLLIESVKPLFGRMRWIFGLAHNRSNELERDEHMELCNAILAGKADLAYSLAYSHIELGREPVLAGLAQTLEP